MLQVSKSIPSRSLFCVFQYIIYAVYSKTSCSIMVLDIFFFLHIVCCLSRNIIIVFCFVKDDLIHSTACYSTYR